ncbi:type II toxin-antitoxin system RelE/ParE family toxin [Granulicella aggregans]|uniref:type II toxin-antitoxin system RelE/ParE family toxin n=1 Tax=Granulicella aggregans TaxID=474949 RepID=UPI0021DFECAA|nr:type II toxin-antitoxin system RelE/ParE family toxin [Granulicella aggregans]
MRYILAPKIKCDLEDIGDWIAQDSPVRALATVRDLRAKFRQIAQNPLHYQLRPDIGEDARLAVIGRYVALFWIDGNVVRFERVAYGGRDLPVLFQ